MEKNHSTFDKTEICESQIDQIQNLKSFDKPPTTHPESTNIPSKQTKNHSMEDFVRSFCQQFLQKSEEIFTVDHLAKLYQVKNRRVYELLGILEGFSFVCKMKKVGHYMWLGVQSKECSFYFEGNKSVALKDIAGLLKLVVSKFRQGLTIKQLIQKIKIEIDRRTNKQQSVKTINRRIYECLKVMKTLGMVEKVNNLYKPIKCKPRTFLKKTENFAHLSQNFAKL